jgi:hypothetical protein
LVPEVVALLGGIVSAVIIALPLNTAFSFLSAESILLAPVIEEPVKMIGVTFLALRYPQVVATKRKGLILGGFAGLGFAFTENLYYATVPGTNVVARALLPVPMHVMASGIAALGLVYFAQRRMALGSSSSHFSLKTVGSLWTVAMVIHGQYNFLSYFGPAGSLVALVVTGFVYYRLPRSLPDNLRFSNLPGPVKLLRSTVQVRVLKELSAKPKVHSVRAEELRLPKAFCVNCGRQIAPSEPYCDGCGASQRVSEVPQHP